MTQRHLRATDKGVVKSLHQATPGQGGMDLSG
jgi:hypothetical protein